MRRIDVLYLCDGEECKSPTRSCRTDGMCRHTTDPCHALYGPCAHPEQEPERFELHTEYSTVGVNLDFYCERDREGAEGKQDR